MAGKIYTSDGIVLTKQALGEASTNSLILTRDYGLMRLRAQSARRSEGKLRYALEPMTLGRFTFVRGAGANRLIGAEAHSVLLNFNLDEARRAVGLIARLLLRLLPGEAGDPELFAVVKDGFAFISEAQSDDIADAECLMVISILSRLGYLPEDAALAKFADQPLTTDRIEEIRALRPQAVRTINRVLALSGL